MEKVRLPKEVAEAIEGVQKHADEALLYDMHYMRDVCENEKFDAPKFQPIWNWINTYGYKEYFKAIVNDFEVVQDPEDKVREMFKKALEEERKRIADDNQMAGWWEGRRMTIIDTLDTLGIKIVGVNA